MWATRNNRAGTVTLALNYGGRAEIADSAMKIAQDVAAGRIKPAEITEETFRKYLYDPELPDPELVIRTSGEVDFFVNYIYTNHICPKTHRLSSFYNPCSFVLF